MHDIEGREYANLDQLKVGDVVETDEDFTCREPGERSRVEEDETGKLFVRCRQGHHYLDGQLAYRGHTEDKNALVGVYLCS